MPFTPYHMGPGMAFKAVLPEKFSLMVYGWSQIVMDIEPLIQIARGEDNWHGLTHNLAGAFLLGAVAAASGKYLVEWGIRLLSLGRRRVKITWPAAMLTGWIGSFSHVLTDSFLHQDMQPFWPFWPGNPILTFGATWGQVEKFCLISGLVGIAVYGLTKIIQARKRWLQAKHNQLEDG
jgi:hypothetical protein